MRLINKTLQDIATAVRLMASEAGDGDERRFDVVIKLHRKRRSKKANDYYWQLLAKYANWSGTSKIRLHNDMLAHYGQELIVDDRCAYTVIADTDKYKDLADLHLKPTSEVRTGRDGQDYRTFKVLRGSHTYNGKEMAILINGLISEIQGAEAPIETMTPAELTRLKGYEPVAA